jgi:hypothetical protein
MTEGLTMPEHTLRITSPTADGKRISGPLLRDLLDLVSDGARRALRLRVEGRSTAKGTHPSWLDSGAGFDFTGLSAGSCVVHLEAPTLALAAPEAFAQGNLFLDNQATAIGLWTQSLTDAIEGKADSELYDVGLLSKTEADLARIFGASVEEIEIRNGSSAAPPLVIGHEAIAQIRSLRDQTPPSRRVRVSGRLDTLRHSDRRFTLILEDGSSVTGVADGVDDGALSALWGKLAVISGLAVFRPSGALLRIEADHVAPALGNDMAIFSEIPRATPDELDLRSLRKPQGARSGVNAIFGKWPGDESDEEFAALIGGRS